MKTTFNNVETWFDEITRYAGRNVCKLLVGNKIDIVDKRVVTVEEGQKLAEGMQVEFLETSAKDSSNVEEAFLKMAALSKEKNVQNTLSSDGNTAKIGGTAPLQQSSSCC